MIKISAHEMHNDLLLPVYQGIFYGSRNKDGRVCIGDTYLKKYIPKHINKIIYIKIYHVDVKLVSVPCYFNLI